MFWAIPRICNWTLEAHLDSFTKIDSTKKKMVPKAISRRKVLQYIHSKKIEICCQFRMNFRFPSHLCRMNNTWSLFKNIAIYMVLRLFVKLRFVKQPFVKWCFVKIRKMTFRQMTFCQKPSSSNVVSAKDVWSKYRFGKSSSKVFFVKIIVTTCPDLT
jgi:hypothetical protein